MTKKETTKTKIENVAEKAMKQPSFYQAVGRRREGTARVRLYVTEDKVVLKEKEIKKGEIVINGRPIENYFPGQIAPKLYLEPLRITNTQGRFAISAIISGGGLMGQLGAFIHGLSRSLIKVDVEKFRPLLKKKGYLMRDPRTKQRHLAGFAQKARAKKQSPKR